MRKKKKIILLGIAIGLTMLMIAGCQNQESSEPTATTNPIVESSYSRDGGFLMTTHLDRGAVNDCLACHDSTDEGEIATKMSELGSGTDEICFTCHSLSSIETTTENYLGEEGLNPHSSHLGEISCGDCHSMHSESILVCNDCHNLQLGKSWINP